MNRTVTSTLAALSLSLLALSAQAQHGSVYTPRIDDQRAQQTHRIEYGVQTGQLTAHEAQRLLAEQERIRQAEWRARADGVVTYGERQHLHHLQHRASHHIYAERHDMQTRYCHPR